MSRIILFLIFIVSACSTPQEVNHGEIVVMPRFTHCKNEPQNIIAQDQCSRKEMNIYINNKLADYSNQYNVGGFTDDFVITFKVRSNGELIDLEAHKGTDKDLKQVMLQIFKSMDNWVPAQTASGSKAAVRLAIPVTIVRGKMIPQ
jgi:PBP1b-binding outer membrane lipoprotein LpoB